MFAPLIAVPCWAYSNDNWYLLFGIPFSYFGSYTSFSPRLRSFILLFTILCIGIWIKTGFSVHQYITLFFFCSLWGYLMARIAEKYDQQSKEGTLDNDQEILKHLSKNKDIIDAKILEHIKENPDKKLTYDEIDKIVRGQK
jgi:hypothetical protein